MAVEYCRINCYRYSSIQTYQGVSMVHHIAPSGVSDGPDQRSAFRDAALPLTIYWRYQEAKARIPWPVWDVRVPNPEGRFLKKNPVEWPGFVHRDCLPYVDVNRFLCQSLATRSPSFWEDSNPCWYCYSPITRNQHSHRLIVPVSIDGL